MKTLNKFIGGGESCHEQKVKPLRKLLETTGNAVFLRIIMASLLTQSIK